MTALAKTGQPRWRTALVTGGSSGIGAALARRLAQEGVQVVVAARRKGKLDALVHELGGGARALELDVTQPDDCVARIRQVDDEVGGLDLVVANAGLGAPQAARKLDWEKVRPVVLTNFVGAMATLTAVLPRMVERKRGHLVGVSSVAVYAPTPGGSAYRGTKTGLSAFLDNLRAELGGTGVDVSAVHPGFVRTPMADNFTAQPPVIVEADVAADLIVRKLRRAPARIDFPTSVVMMMRLIGWLPTFVSDRLVRAVELGPSS